jgi:phosphatidylinositol glycan class V
MVLPSTNDIELSKLCDNRVLETEYSQAGVAIIIANISHLLSVLVLYKLTRKIWPESQGKNQAFISASLHILSPAGLFLSAPYAESSFSLLSFLGYLSYAKGLQNTESILGDLQVVVAGAVFGIATTFRSNGLLNGTVFLLDFLIIIRASLQTGLELARARRALALAIGGCLIGIGFIIPQGIAWHEYCSSDSGRLGGTRPWCLKMIPSIYTWVQSYYW